MCGLCFGGRRRAAGSPTQDAQNQIENEEGAQEDERDEVNPGPFVSYGVVDLKDTAEVTNTEVVHTKQAVKI